MKKIRWCRVNQKMLLQWRSLFLPLFRKGAKGDFLNYDAYFHNPLSPLRKGGVRLILNYKSGVAITLICLIFWKHAIVSQTVRKCFLWRYFIFQFRSLLRFPHAE